VPSFATILNTQMKLYYYSASNGGSGSWVDRWVQAHQILVNWNETQATRDNRLTGTPWNVAYVGLNDIDAKSTYESTILFQSGQTNTWKSWDITALTQKWVNGTATNYGVVLWATNEGTNGYDLRFRASEYTTTSLRPYLQVTYSTSSKTVYFLKDHLGSVRATVDNTGAVVGYDDYDPWGYILANRSLATPWSSVQGTAKNKFTGKEWDDEFGVNWYDFPARDYDPQIGRWLSRDPLAEKYPGWSPYNYTLDNPVKFDDPTGGGPRLRVQGFQPPPSFAEIKQNFLQSVEESRTLASAGLTQLAVGRLGLGVIEAAGSVLENLDPFGISGLVNPIAATVGFADDAIRFGQKSVSTTFSEGGLFKGASLESVVQQLKSGALKADDVPIRFVVIEGQKVAVDNRSLTVLSQAGLKPTKLKDVTSDKRVLREVQKRLTKMEGKPSKTIKIRDEEGTVVHIVE
jgi:RHS repeat-associated protein